MAYRITEPLRRTWRDQRDQSAEELASGRDQNGRMLSPSALAEMRQEIEDKNKLLGYPVGTKFEKVSDLL